jgi:hypothetical protein
MPKHGFYYYDNLRLLFNYSHVVIFGLHALKVKCQFTTLICNYKIIVTNIYN